jgi:very-short-patch-repair endonuclease
MLCLTCKKELVKSKRFCSRACYDKCRSKRSEKVREKQRISAKSYYNSIHYQENRKSRNTNISYGRKRKFLEQELDILKELLKYRFVKDLNVIVEKSQIPKVSKRSLSTLLLDNKEIQELYLNAAAFVPIRVQRWSNDYFVNFKNDCNIHDHRMVEKKYELSAKTFHHLCKVLNLRWGRIQKFRNKETAIEKIIRLFLEENNVVFSRETYICNNKWRIDFLLEPNKIIEVNGDYWHANPVVYDYKKLSAVQKSNILRDIERNSWISKNNYEILTVWEKDIYENFELIKNQILKYAKHV